MNRELRASYDELDRISSEMGVHAEQCGCQYPVPDGVVPRCPVSLEAVTRYRNAEKTFLARWNQAA